jgi:DNA (cytosine-5)-methyltransferase 1
MRAAVFFSGAAGTSVGARQAGADVVAAYNHNPVCVAVHAANFPDCENVCQDLHLANYAAAPVHDVLLASPVCRANSKASQPARARAAAEATGQGRSPESAAAQLAAAHNAYRALPWSVVDACEVNRPRFVVIENVPEFVDWVFFADWLRMLRRLGYKLTQQCLNARAWGVPQDRERLFVVGSLGKPIRVRDPKPDKPAAMQGAVDWHGGDWLPFSACPGEKAREQLERAHREFKGAQSFVALVGHRPVYSASEPVRTMTRQDQIRWVYRGRFRYPTAREAFNLMGFPGDYVIPDEVAERRTVAWQLAGDAVCPPVMRGIVDRLMRAA